MAVLSTSQNALAQTETGLCPENFQEGVVTTGYVDCFRTTTATSDREEAERRRLVREAECLTEPRSELIFSAVLADRNGRFFPSLICRINRIIPPGTLLCPDGSLEVYRAFDTLVCEYFGSASISQAAAEQALAMDVQTCTSNPGGSVLTSSIRLEESQDDEVPFFFTDLSCGFKIPATDVFECPVGFDEQSRNEDFLTCERDDEGLVTENAANQVSQQVQSICSSTTANLGQVISTSFDANTSSSPFTFSSEVECEINLPRFGDFVEGDIVRACDVSCTQDIELVRPCLNGGQVGGPGCTEPATQILTKMCNTGIDPNGLCPLKGVPTSNIVPLLLLEDDEDE